jgi:hypothetical protein
LDALAETHVCLSLVTDPFGDYDESLLKECFPHTVRPFKQHFVTDLSQTRESIISSHNARNARKSLERLKVERCESSDEFTGEWRRLYASLVQRHKIRGFAAFSEDSLERQLRVPGLVAFRASFDSETVGALLWYVQGDICYYHLGAYSDQGYDLLASFGLFSASIDYFQHAGCRWLSLGAGAGVEAKEDDGLSRFKRGWSTETRPTFFCCRIFDQSTYESLSSRWSSSSGFFPRYRAGEFD